MGCLLGEAPGAHDFHLPWPADPHVGGGSQLAPHPPPCSLSEVSLGKVLGLGAAVAELLGVEFGGDGGSVVLRRQPGVPAAPSFPLGSADGEAASLHTLGVHRWVVLGLLGTAGGFAFSARQPGPGGAAWGRRGLLKNGGGTGDPAGWG